MGGERPVDPACSDPCCGRGHKRPDVPQAIQRGFRMLWRGGCPVCDPRDWRRSTGSVAVGLMECGSRYTVEDSGFHPQFNTLRGIPPAITISMREWDLRSHGPMIAKMDSTPPSTTFGRDGDRSYFRVPCLLPKHVSPRAWCNDLLCVCGDACDARVSLLPLRNHWMHG